jgi:hypothetical protein
MALLDTPAEASYRFRLFALTTAVASSSDRLGTIDLPCISVEPLSPMALHDAPAEASYGFRLFALTVAVASGADRLGTIDLPCPV